MKIGIVTWHKGNIGSTLQAYALSETLRRLGHEPELINIIENRFTPILTRLRSLAFHVCFLKSGLTRDNTHRFVANNIHESPPLLYDELKDYSKKFDAVICGSDQIWSCQYAVNPYYFLQFVPAGKRIAYAPSVGFRKIKDEFQSDYIKAVSSIPFLSVREETGARVIHDLTGLSPKVVLDPTFLLSADDWLSLTQDVTLQKFGLKKENFILCYYLGNHKLYEDYTRRVAEKLGMRPVYVSFKRKNFGRDQLVCTIGEFLALIRDSRCILTDSFHCTIVPLNMGKKVAVFERFSNDDPFSQNSRIYDALKKFEAEDWIVSPSDGVETFLNRQDDHARIQSLLEIERKDSLSYLRDSLLKVQGTASSPSEQKQA